MTDTRGLLTAATDLFEPLSQALSSRDALADFLLQFGWTLGTDGTDTAVTSTFGSFGSAVSQLQTDASAGASEDVLANDVASVVTALANIGSGAISGLPTPLNQAAFWSSFPTDVLEFQVFDWTRRHTPPVYGVLRAAGVLDSVDQPADASSNRAAWTRRTLRVDRIGLALSDPSALFADVYGWGTTFKHELFVDSLAALLTGLRMPARAGRVDRAIANALYAPTNTALPSARQVAATLLTQSVDTDVASAIVKLSLVAVPVPPSADNTLPPDGFAIMPFVSGDVSTTVGLGQGIALELRGGLDVSIIRAEIRPNGVTLTASPPVDSIDAAASLQVSREQPLIVLGTPGATHIEASAARLTLGYALTGTTSEFSVTLAAQNLQLIVAPPADDGFLASAFGSDPARVQLPGEISWSSARGVRFGSSERLDLAIPLHLDLAGLLQITSVHIVGQQVDGPATQVDIAISGGLTLGPLVGTVSNIGLRVRVAPASVSAPGNLGPLDVAIAFKPPDGLGLAIDASVVVGGGFLLFDPDAEQYAGAVQLELANTVSLSAFGLLTTRMPDGSRGFSLLVIMSAEFTPSIQLGFGFSLDAVGGLLGVNRTVDVEVLRAGLHSGSLGSVLFPIDPIRNAPRIISDLQAIFPPAPGRFLIGPMLRIGWGTPRLLTIDLGLVLELPAPVRLLILGRLGVLLPEEDYPVVRLRLDAIGIIDFTSGDLALDAVLYDSHVAQFAVTGAMALRANWGARPGFVLAVGGFNPRFPVPDGFPRLEAVAISLATTDNPRIRLEAYLALTSNTVQFGAHLDLFAHEGAFSVEGYLGFDVLITLAPFGFVAALGAAVALKYNGRSVLSVALDMTLCGPTPWHAWGTATFKVVVISGSVSFDVRLGGSDTPPLPPPTSVRPRLIDALSNADNWTTQVAAGEHPLVTVRDRPGATDRLVHPLADLRVLQHVVPLDRDITRFGAAVPVELNFHLAVAAGGGAALSVDTVGDFFAPAEFRDMTDEEKITAPAFEQLPAGLRFGVHTYSSGATVVENEINYTTRTVYAPAAAASSRLLASTLAATAPTSTERTHRVPAGFVARVAAVGAAGRAALAPESLPRRGPTVNKPVFTLAFGRGLLARAAAPTRIPGQMSPTSAMLTVSDYLSARQVLGQRRRGSVRVVSIPVGARA